MAETVEVFTSCWPSDHVTNSCSARSLSLPFGTRWTNAHGSGGNFTTTRANLTGRTAAPVGKNAVPAAGGASSALSVRSSAALVGPKTLSAPTAQMTPSLIRIGPPTLARSVSRSPTAYRYGPYPSLNTPNSFPAGSLKWNRRPPGKLKMARVMVPPAASTLACMASRSRA